MALAIGTRVGAFELTGTLGAGGMGEVYRARDSKLGRDVALKILPDHLIDADRLARFTREAQVVASLSHPNIAAIHGLEQLDGKPVLVLELVEGPTLADRIAQGAIPQDEAVAIARQIAEALEAAHEQGVVHRDLKPANVKLRPDGLVKVLDFGLAKLTEGPAKAGSYGTDATLSPTITSPAMTGLGLILGTAAYMSPEQAAGKPADKRADIWSFGVVLWEMLTGERLFGDGESTSHVLADVLRAPIDFEKIPAGSLRELVRRCLDRNVKTRLRDIGEARVVLSRPIDAPPLVRDVAAPRRSTLVPWAVAALLAVAIGVEEWAPWRAAEPQRVTTRLEVDLGANIALPATSNSNNVVVSPDGTRLVFVASMGGGLNRLYVKRLDALEDEPPVALPGTENASAVAFKPDGQSLAFLAGNRVYRTSVDGGAPLRLAEIDAPNSQITWGDGDSIIVSGLGTGLLRVPPTGGDPVPVTELADNEIIHAQPSVLAGGKTVLFIAGKPGSDEASIEAVPIDGGARKRILQNGASPRYVQTGHLLYLHRNTLFAVRFDPEQLEAKGEPVPIVDDVKTTLAGQFEVGGFSLDARDTLVYRKTTGITTELAVGGQSPSTVDVIDATRRSALVADAGIYLDPAMSPNETELALTVVRGSGMDVAVFDSRRDTVPRRLTFNGVSSDPVWIHNDGRHLAFVSAASNALTRQGGGLYWMRTDGGEPSLLLQNVRVRNSGSYHPPSNRLAYVASESAEGRSQIRPNIFLVDISEQGGQLKAGVPERFTSQSFPEGDPEFSPDGRWIAFVTNRGSGRTEVWVRAVVRGKDGTRFERQISIDGGSNPQWARERPELLYQAPGDRIMAVRYTATGETLEPDKPAVRVEQVGGTTWDMTRDGRIVVITPVERSVAATPAPEHHVVFLQNLFDDLRRRVK